MIRINFSTGPSQACLWRSRHHPCSTVTYSGATMAIDVYLQIDGIKGESQDDKHKDWIEVTGVHWGIHQPRSATASTGGGHTAERVEMSDISFSKLADLSSPILA